MVSQVQAQSTQSFLDSIGVATHVDSGAANWMDTKAILSELSYLGINQVRDGTPFAWTMSAFVTLAQAGIRFDLQIANQYVPAAHGTINVTTDINNAALLQKAVPGSVFAIEGANEYNINNWYFNGQSSYGNLNWSVAVDAAISKAVLATPVLAGVDIVASSTGAHGLSMERSLMRAAMSAVRTGTSMRVWARICMTR
ncbi:hypothetical protein ACTGJ9_036145 [Bradyrhizobium sp. RDM12]